MYFLDKYNIFESGDLGRNLRSKSLRGGLTTFASQMIRSVVTMTLTVIMARLLTPSEYGLYGMAWVIIAFARMFMEAGLSTATIQSKIISHEQISSLFWVNLFINMFLSTCVLMSAPFIAKFYSQPELLGISATLAITFIFNGLVVQHEALLRRHMMLGSVGLVSVVAELSAFCITITLALLGWKYWALVAGNISISVVRTVGIFYFCRWIPGRFKRRSEIRGMISYGYHLTGANVFIYLGQNLDKILIGKYLGASALGIYTRAFRLFMLPVSEIRMPVTSVALPVMSAIKDQQGRYAQYYEKLVDVLATATLPLTVYCAVEADFIVRLLLGAQWDEVIPVFRIMAIAGLIVPITHTFGVVLLTLGLSKRYLYLQIADASVKIVAIIIGLSYGINGVTIGYVGATYVVFLPSLYFCFHRTPISAGMLMKTFSKPLLTSGGSIIFARAIAEILFVLHGPAYHLVLLGAFLLAYGCASCVRHSIRVMVYQVFWHLLDLAKMSKSNIQKQ